MMIIRSPMEELEVALQLFVANSASLPAWDVLEHALSSSPQQALKALSVCLSDSLSDSLSRSRSLCTAYSWELFDMMFVLTTTTTSTSTRTPSTTTKDLLRDTEIDTRESDEDDGTSSLDHIDSTGEEQALCGDYETHLDFLMKSLCECVRAKEIEIMLMERLYMHVENYRTWRMLIYGVQCFLVVVMRNNSEAVIEEKFLLALFSKLSELRALEGDDNKKAHFAKRSVRDVVNLVYGLLSKSTARTNRLEPSIMLLDINYRNGELLKAMLCKLAGQFVATEKNSDVRDEMMESLTTMFITIIMSRSGSVEELMNYFQRSQQKMFKLLKSEAKDLHLMSATKTKFDDLSIEEAVADKELNKAVWNFVSCQHVKPYDDVVSPSLLALSPKSRAFDDGDAIGFALIIHQIALSMGTYNRGKSISSALPMIFSKEFYETLHRQALNYLIIFTDISGHEGLKALITLYPSSGQVSDLRRYEVNHQIFVPQWATTTSEQVVSDFGKLLYGTYPRDLDVQREMQGCIAAAQSTNIWTYTQCLITALATSHNFHLRTAGFNSFKCLLVELSPVSVFLLLSHVIDKCPYAQMIAVLVDIVKAIVQFYANSISFNHGVKITQILRSSILPRIDVNLPFHQQQLLSCAETDAHLICNRMKSLERIDLIVMSSVTNGDYNVCYSSMVLTRFGILPLGKLWKTLNEAHRFTMEEIDYFGAIVNLISYIVSRLKRDMTDHDNSPFLDCLLLGSSKESLTGNMRDWVDVFVILDKLQKGISKDSYVSTSTIQLSRMESLRVELLQANIEDVMQKIEDMLKGCSFLI